MNELMVHVRKDLRTQFSDSVFILLVTALVMISILMAFQSSISYLGSIHNQQLVVADLSVDMARRQALSDFWGSTLSIFTIVILLVSSFSLTGEKETGMTKFVLTYRTSKFMIYLSRFIVLSLLVLLACFISLFTFFIVFSIMDLSVLGAEFLLASMVFPLLILLAFGAFGLLVSTLSSKRSAVISVALIAFVLGSIMVPTLQTAAYEDVYRHHPGVTYSNYTQYVSFEYLVGIFAYPMSLREGISQTLQLDNLMQVHFLSVEGDLIAGAILVLALFFLGYAIFNRERMEGPSAMKRLSLKVGAKLTGRRKKK